MRFKCYKYVLLPPEKISSDRTESGVNVNLATQSFAFILLDMQ